MTAGGEVRTKIINRRACDRTRAGLAQAIAWYEVRATNYQPEVAQSVESRKHSRRSVGSYSKVGICAGVRAIERERGVSKVTV
jgi:hypothetical protein